MEVTSNTKKIHRVVWTICGMMAVFAISFALVFRSTQGGNVGMLLGFACAMLYIYVISGMLLKRRFQRLGQTTGMTPDHIETIVGVADQVRKVQGEIVGMAWSITTYNVDLEFSNGRCTTDLDLS